MWLIRPRHGGTVRARLFCFPYAGGGASVYRTWGDSLPRELGVYAVQLPGRESRLREPPVPSIPLLVEQLLPALREKLDLPFAFFGHSMGAVLASEVARALAAAGDPVPHHLFVSARRAPHVASPEAPIHHLPDDEFVVEMERRYGGIPAEIRREAELMAMLLPKLKADMAALETFEPTAVRPLNCPLSAFGGSDDPRAPREHLDSWREHTTAAFRVRVFPGGHFYIHDRQPELLQDVAATLAPMLASAHVESVA